MEIGGFDTIFVTDDPQQLLQQILSFVNWKDAVVEDAVIENDDLRDIFYYENQAAKYSWDEDIGNENSMIYFVFGDKELTVVTDKELTDRIREAFPNWE